MMDDLFSLPFEEDREPAAAAPSRRVFTVSELTAAIRTLLESGFGDLWVEGEISNCRVWNTGHMYFTLKDGGAQLKAIMFRGAVRNLKFKAEDGQRVVARGRLGLYDAKGEYQLVCEHLQPQGLGALQLAFEQLKKKLQAEGLFDAARKRPLPSLPRKIGIVTSLEGAAIRDIIQVLTRRHPNAHLVIRPARVQGEGAAADLARALRAIGKVPGVDVVIAGRGGGSVEDLWAFNEEVVARAIADSPVPVVSAVGHEVDFTIADFVADLLAPTPSAAAELVVREKQAVVDALAELRSRLEHAAARPLRDLDRRVDELTTRLRRGMHAEWRRAAHRVELGAAALRSASPVARMANGRHRLERLETRMRSETRQALAQAQHRLRSAVGRLDSLSPLAVLGRGYSLTRTPTGEIVRSARQVSVGDDVRVLLHQGTLECRVAATKEQDDRPQV